MASGLLEVFIDGPEKYTDLFFSFHMISFPIVNFPIVNSVGFSV